MLNTKNNASARMSYENVRLVIFNAWIKSFQGDQQACWDYVNSLKLAENTVRLENLLTAANTNYIFGVTPQQQSTSGVKFKTENRLNQGDTLIITSYGLFLGQPATADINDVNYKLHTYADPVAFGADSPLLNNILYSNSNLKLTVNNDVLLPGIDVFRHLYVPETQATAASGAGSPIDQICGAEDGFVAVEPNLYLIGSKNSIPELILPATITALASTTTRLVLMFRGFLAQNSTVVS